MRKQTAQGVGQGIGFAINDPKTTGMMVENSQKTTEALRRGGFKSFLSCGTAAFFYAVALLINAKR
jgi:hypothetical protein